MLDSQPCSYFGMKGLELLIKSTTNHRIYSDNYFCSKINVPMSKNYNKTMLQTNYWLHKTDTEG